MRLYYTKKTHDYARCCLELFCSTVKYFTRNYNIIVGDRKIVIVSKRTFPMWECCQWPMGMGTRDRRRARRHHDFPTCACRMSAAPVARRLSLVPPFSRRQDGGSPCERAARGGRRWNAAPTAFGRQSLNVSCLPQLSTSRKSPVSGLSSPPPPLSRAPRARLCHLDILACLLHTMRQPMTKYDNT